MAKNDIKFRQLQDVAAQHRILGRVDSTKSEIAEIVLQNDPGSEVAANGDELASAEVIKNYVDSKVACLAWKQPV